MKFNFEQSLTTPAKNRYFDKAEKFIEENELSDLLKVNRSVITMSKEVVKVYCESFHKKGNTKKFNAMKKAHPCIKEVKKEGYFVDNHGSLPAILTHPYIELPREEKE